MNAQRRNRLVLENVKNNLTAICDEEDEARWKMPENLESSDRYERSEECSDAISDAADSVDDAIGDIASAIESVQNAI